MPSRAQRAAAQGGARAAQPGLYVYRSNRVEVLVELLAELIRQPDHRPADPFAPVQITVGSLGMERWLRHELALRHGICTNVTFPFPAQLVSRVLGEADQDPWSPEVLTWRILESFARTVPQWDEVEGVAPLRTYLKAHGGDPRPGDVVSGGEFELAQRVADIFDGYVTYRPEWAVQASAGELPLDPEDPLRWQVALWRELAQSESEHTAQRIRALRKEKFDPEPFDQPIRLFGITSLPPSLLAVLEYLGRHVAVEIYLVCPSDQWWAELHKHRKALRAVVPETNRDDLGDRLREITGPESRAVRPHPLLASLGRVARDVQLLLESVDHKITRSRDVFVDVTDQRPFVDPAADPSMPGLPTVPALWRLQSDILNLRDPTQAGAQGLLTFAVADDSIQIHACHGATRQVEVLRDVLHQLFADHPHLEPRDVVVMCPDIDTYAPLISAVFDQGFAQRRSVGGVPDGGPEGWGPSGAPRIPYQVADLSVRRQNPVADALLRVLALGAEGARVTASAVLDLLAVEPVRQRFDLSEEDLEWVGRWVREVGVRWGIDADDRARAGQPRLDQNTWRFGLERLALGVTMADDGPLLRPTGVPERRIAPYDPLEGGRVALVGRLMAFTDALFDVLATLTEPAPISAWIDRLTGVLDRLTKVAPAAAWLRTRVRNSLQALGEAAQRAGSRRPLTLEAVSVVLDHRFSLASASAQPHTGAVTFGTLLPYRSVPYRVVCLLGMDEDAFPRNPARPRFDRLALEPRVGDRDVRDEDRHLLLEAIGSAREHLIVTYAGRDVRTNEVRPPAPPIGDLIDVLEATFGADTLASMRREHPLQAFSPRNFEAKPAGQPWSFDRRLRAGAAALAAEEHVVPTFFEVRASGEALRSGSEFEDAITLDELCAYLAQPAKYLLQRRFGVYLGRRDDAPLDREPVELDGLDRWKLVDALFREDARGREDGPDLTTRIAQLRARGEIPFGIAGELGVSAASEAVDRLDALIRHHVPEVLERPPDEAMPFALPLPLELRDPRAPTTVRLVGSVAGRHGSSLFRTAAGSALDAQRGIEPWLSYLAAVAHEDGMGVERCVIGLAKSASAGRKTGAKVGLANVQLASEDRRETARRLLTRYVRWYMEGRTHAVPLFPRASVAFVDKLRNNNSAFELSEAGLPDRIVRGELRTPEEEDWVRKALVSADEGFRKIQEFSRRDLDEPHLARVWPHGWTDDRKFMSYAIGMWWPLREATTWLQTPTTKRA